MMHLPACYAVVTAQNKLTDEVLAKCDSRDKFRWVSITMSMCCTLGQTGRRSGHLHEIGRAHCMGYAY